MIHQSVVSSNINEAGWHRGTLYLRFNSGICYSYERVPLKTYLDLIGAESAGGYFHQHIRSKFTYTKLEHDPFVLRKAA